MKLSRQYFDSKGDFYMDDFPIDCTNKDVMYKIFNDLPTEIQCLAISWGLSNTVFRDRAFEHACKTYLKMDCKRYYQSQIAKDYFEKGILIELNI